MALAATFPVMSPVDASIALCPIRKTYPDARLEYRDVGPSCGPWCVVATSRLIDDDDYVIARGESPERAINQALRYYS